MIHYRLAPSFLLLVSIGSLASCGDDASSSQDTDDGNASGDLEFSGEQPLLPGLDVDTGWLPDGSPVAVRATASADGRVSVVAHATTDGEMLVPTPGTGTLALEGSLGFEVSARIDYMGLNYEGIVDSFVYAIEPSSETFDPFAIGAAITLSTALPAAELGSVPIPSVPGATLVLEVTGGELTTAFAGTCADARDGFGQYTGTITMQGTVACAATVEVAIPIIGTKESFGPFAFDVPIPAIESPTDLGTRSLATGEPADGMGVCDVNATTAADDAGTGDAGTGDTGSDDVADTSGGDADTTESGDPTFHPTDESDDTASTGGHSGDPDYPQPDEDGGCPAGDVSVGVNSKPFNGICLPPCGDDDSCPSGATGNATAVCGFSPDSTYLECASDIDCSAVEHCEQALCVAAPSHCVLLCDDTETCPDAMTCLLGACTYPL